MGGGMLLTFVQHSNLKKKGISCSSVGRPVPPIRHSGLKKTHGRNESDMFFVVVFHLTLLWIP